ncbi:adenylate/guanylate cyclase domain-containing protein [Bremerella sp. T1]|uniref:adenylate/guanylate cyclase domain-containing protein n=1 Tax=Bremerella sp. TYQ1 TaxID=3119568 RepID=UPI001CCBC811|nr:adenylate/guanylate cyclase domain-containing protein [Bremerella volcania]UBM35710.1 adenylate/guanylate cyclase domain-containing protein [Bremerella volcania]
MAELFARDTLSSQRWRRRLVPNQPIVIGRTTPKFPIAWDKQISSQHAQLNWNGVQLEVRKVEEAVNPIFYNSRPRISFMLDPGKHFVIGHTEFLLLDSEPTMPLPHRSPKTEVTIRPEEIRKASFRKTPGRIELLTELVSKMTASTDHEQLIVITLQQLLQGIPHATEVLLLEPTQSETGPQFAPIAWDSRDGISTPRGSSRSLIENAVHSQMCVLHVWPSDPDPAESDYTQIAGHDWAMCIPIQIKLQQVAALYISGKRARLEGNLTEVELLQDDIKFAELAGSTFANLSRNLALERRQSQLNQFFTPGLLDHVSSDLDSFLAPREADLMVLFCDLRGFSRATEEHFDRLIPYLNHTSETLSIITAAILAQQGVIGDFHGDAVMGFWGWPVDAAENPLGAIQAGWEIAQALAGTDFLCAESPPKAGIGIAAGRAVAGMIGSRDQVKVTAFGPPVNLAARIEGLTKPLGVPFLLDEKAVAQLQQHPSMPPNTFLRLGNFRLAGLRQATQIFTVNSGEQPWTAHYSQALASFEDGNWPQTKEMLEEVPESFGPRKMLYEIMAQHENRCPADWNGTIERTAK